ncbi:MAG: aminotransferase class I/II-fold pyridoxal phosphate-dependent enzyme [Elusimicrobiaceae bacterium]|nr:aminotransferase class I/II-fold pyridoxal phosphate-dependent enzyme [Elusimicrobiaceae bacterium]
MIRFNCDYSEGAHPLVLEKLSQTNLEQLPGYGQDTYCLQAAEHIRQLCQAPEAGVHFLCGGTQTNLTVIAAMLRPYQCVISADCGHINVHEAGAIEMTGHRILTAPHQNGKITAEQINRLCREYWQDDNPEFAPQPKLVYISFPTEFGTLYSKQELQDLRRACDENNLYLFMDGARLGYGLAAPGNDVTWADIAACCDAFYIGGTKLGALLGEAVVIPHPKLQKDFRYFMKQHGAVLAKGRILGIQFLTLLKDDLYLQLAHHANRMALQIRQAFQEAQLPFLYDSPTNQQFPIVPNTLLKHLEEEYVFAHIKPLEHRQTAIRICTSWATQEEDVQHLIADLKRLTGK